LKDIKDSSVDIANAFVANFYACDTKWCGKRRCGKRSLVHVWVFACNVCSSCSLESRTMC